GPVSVAAFEAVEVAAAVDAVGCALGVFAGEDEVGLGVGGVAVDLAEVVDDEVVMHLVALSQEARDPGHELFGGAGEHAVVVDRSRVVHGADDLGVEAVDPAGVAVGAVENRLPGGHAVGPRAGRRRGSRESPAGRATRRALGCAPPQFASKLPPLAGTAAL